MSKSLDIATVRVAAQTVGTKHYVTQAVDVRFVHVDYTSTATVGNRTLKFGLYDSSDNKLYDINSGVNQAASLTRHYNFVHGVARETSFAGGDEVVLPLADIVLVPGMYLKVTDVNGVDAADTYDLVYQGDK